MRPPSSRPSMSRAVSVASDARASVTPVGGDATSDFRLRKKVLLSNPELAQLHRELVMGGHISENEFWEGREVSLSTFLQGSLSGGLSSSLVTGSVASRPCL